MLTADESLTFPILRLSTLGPTNISLTPGYGQKDLNISQEVEAERQEAQQERMWSFWDN